MSEPKRATLSTISTQKADVKKVKEKSKTIRFSLTLPESNEKSCPEYNYRDLLNSAEKKHKSKEKPQGHVNGINNLDPFEEDDEADLKRIAQRFEAKYGGVPTKKRRGKKDDYADIGAGYDESDSFIDNTDAYDEMVPEDVTTLHGGFYINSGALEFKQVELSGSESSDSEPEPDTTITPDKSAPAAEKPANRKRIIEDTDESDSEEEKDKEEAKAEHAEKKQKLDNNGIQKVAKKKLPEDFSKEISVKKIKKIDENLLKKKSATVKELLREKREEFDITIDTSIVVEPAPKDTIKTTGSSTINDVIESVINAGRVEHVDETSKDSCSSDEVAVVSGATTDSDASRDGLPASTAQTESARPEPEMPIVKLPENVPNAVLDIVNNIKKAAEISEGKVKFFSGPVNTMLLNLEINCRKLSKSVRLQVYEHLAPFVKCKKDTLIRRAKNLLLDQEKNKITDPLGKLRTLIDEIMPVIIKSYEKECLKVRDEMFLASATANSENGEVNHKVRRPPRKRFPWSEEARKALQEIIAYKKKCYTLEKSRKETFEEYLDAFLKSSVLPLWPEGWMSLNLLMKQVKLFTETTQNPKRPKQSQPMSPISLDIHAISAAAATATPFALSPVKNMSLSPSGITVIPLQPSAAANGPRPPPKHASPPPATSAASVINLSAEICAVPTHPKETSAPVASALTPTIPIPKSSSISITSVDLRTNNHTSAKKDSLKDDECMTPISATSTPIKPTNLKQRILNDHPQPKSRVEAAACGSAKPSSSASVSASDECQIIDLTDSPLVVRKPGPKSKTRYVDGAAKQKRTKESTDAGVHRPAKAEEMTGSQALNHLITGLAKYSSAEVASSGGKKENHQAAGNEDDMEQVMKDLKELQQLQEHARKNDIDIMAPSSSPVSVIAYNSSYSPSRLQPSDLSAAATATAGKERKLNADGSGFQDMFQKHLFQEVPFSKQSQSSSVYNSNVQPKNNYNSINNFSYSTAGSISNSLNSNRYNQSSSKYSAVSHLPANPAGATNHTDDFALFQNFLYQYGFHNASGSKQKSPP